MSFFVLSNGFLPKFHLESRLLIKNAKVCGLADLIFPFSFFSPFRLFEVSIPMPFFKKNVRRCYLPPLFMCVMLFYIILLLI